MLLPLEDGIAGVKGFYCGGVKAGLKKDGYDLGFIYSDTPFEVVALFTQNRFQAAPIKHFQRHQITHSNFLLVNSKNANAMTAEAGIKDIEDILSSLPFEVKNPFMSSTGVIGERLPKEKIIPALKKIKLKSKDEEKFALSILTTDTFPKKIAFEVKLEDGRSFNIAGVAKGAGMINPSLATMLAFITTDAAVPRSDMEEGLKKFVDRTFNAISVDGDTSTNDSVFLLTNRKSKVYDKEAFEFALLKVMHYLALLIVKDGEGATKLVGFEVSGAKDENEAKRAAKALTNSLLVKTALFGEDPNWGRIASTIGASGVEAYEERLRIAFEDVVLFDRGKILSQNEEDARKIMQREEFTIYCDLGVGKGRFKAYGCDLGYEYVKINAEYRS